MLGGYARGRRNNLARGAKSAAALVDLVGLCFGDSRAHCADHLADPRHTPRSPSPLVLYGHLGVPDRGYYIGGSGPLVYKNVQPLYVAVLQH